MHVIPIDDLSPETVAPGTKERLLLDIFPGLAGSVTIPALVAGGQRTGPVLLAVAGVHGDEYEGMEAVRRVFDDLDPGTMAGVFIGLPVVNPFAYEARSRIAPLHVDGLNLARTFPGNPDGSPSQALAHALLALVLRCVPADGLFVDFHSGSADVAFAPMIGFREVTGPAQTRAEEAARHFGFERLWRIPDGPGPFNAETSRRGVPTVATETTGRAGCRPDDVAGYVRGLLNLLAFVGITSVAEHQFRNDGVARRTVEILSPAPGFLRGAREINEEIVPGETLGTVLAITGEPVAEIVSPVAGTIWAARSMPAVRRGELAYMIALA